MSLPLYTPEANLSVRLSILESLGFAMQRWAGETGEDFHEDWRLDAWGTRTDEKGSMEAFLGSYFFRIGSRATVFFLRLHGVPVEGEAQVATAHFEVPILATVIRRLRGYESRQKTGEESFDERYSVWAPSAEEASRALPEPLRRVLLAATFEVELHISKGHIALRQLGGYMEAGLDTDRETIALAEAIAKSLRESAA